MKEYYIKIGDMYIDNVSTDDSSIKTMFIYRVSIKGDNKYATKVKEGTQDRWAELLKEVLKLQDNAITFEEVKEEDNQS